jgi:hypothetical protein
VITDFWNEFISSTNLEKNNTSLPSVDHNISQSLHDINASKSAHFFLNEVIICVWSGAISSLRCKV